MSAYLSVKTDVCSDTKILINNPSVCSEGAGGIRVLTHMICNCTQLICIVHSKSEGLNFHEWKFFSANPCKMHV